MGCRLIQRTLVAYYFGVADAPARDATDAHLVGCPSCLKAYLEIKRHAEAQGDDDEPSDALRARLREEIAELVRPHLAARIRRWALGPVPRYHLVSAAALVLVVAALVAREAARAPEPPVSARIDSSRTAEDPPSFQ
jgi:predicted anti-sigma-YlaC factor YlaD